MSIASRYLLFQYLTAVAVVTCGIAITWIAADTLFHIDELATDPAQTLRDLAFRALDALPLTLPLACVAGVVWSLSRAVRYREITAIRCGGIALQGSLLPLLIATVALAGLVMLIEDRLIVPARAELSEPVDDASSGPPRRPLRINGRWWYANGGSLVSAGSYEREETRFLDVTVFDFDGERRIQRRVEAESATWLGGDQWRLVRTTVLSFPEAGGMESAEFDSLDLDLALSKGDVARAVPPAAATSLHKLWRRVREASPDDPERFVLESTFHARIAQPLAALVLVLFAIRFAIGEVERGDSLARSLLLALAVTGAFWLCFTGALLTAQTGVVPPSIPVWGVLALGLALGLGRFRAIPE